MNFYYWNMSQKSRFSKIKWHHHAGGHDYQLLNMYCVGGNCFKENITSAESFPLSHSSLATDRFHHMGGNSSSVTWSGFIDIRSSKAFPSSNLGLGFLQLWNVWSWIFFFQILSLILWFFCEQRWRFLELSFLAVDYAFSFYFIFLWNMDCVLDLPCFIGCDEDSNIMYFT